MMLAWSKFLRWLPALLVAGAVGLAIWWLVSVVQDRAELRADLELERRARIAAEAEAGLAREARRVHQAYLEKAESDRLEAEALLRDLSNMEGGNAPLSDYMRRAGERLWGK